MKSTQTKIMNFSDTGLDFSPGSKSLFPDRFKKMLAVGFNIQIVTAVVVAGNQVTLTYGGAHGYVADRVLKIDSGPLSEINGGEFWIDSVTVNTVTLTIESAPVSVATGFTTRIASLGWDLVYEQANIQLYKLKDMDESDLFLRICFQLAGNFRSCVSPCIGKTANILTGEITDPYSTPGNQNIMNPTAVAAGYRWEFNGVASTTYDNYTGAQGVALWGPSVMMGSKYHLLFMLSQYNVQGRGVINGFIPTATHNYAPVKRPLLISYDHNNAAGVNTAALLTACRAMIGNVRCSFTPSNTLDPLTIVVPQAYNSYLSLDEFNTTTCEPIPLYEYSTRQHLGYVQGGMYIAKYGATGGPSVMIGGSPLITKDIDLLNDVVVHYIGYQSNSANSAWFAMPVEPIKYA